MLCQGGLPGARVPSEVEEGSAVRVFIPRTDGFERLVLLGSDLHVGSGSEAKCATADASQAHLRRVPLPALPKD